MTTLIFALWDVLQKDLKPIERCITVVQKSTF